MIDGQQIYIWDKFLKKVFIYSRSGFKKISEFGGHGEGPGKFQAMTYAAQSSNKLYIAAFPKLCIFSKKGTLLEELKGPVDAGSFLPLGDRFIGVKYPFAGRNAKKRKVVFSLHDSDLDEKKEFFEIELRMTKEFTGPKIKVEWLEGCLKRVAYNNKLFIGSSEDRFYFAVFNQNGDMIYEIDRPYEKIKVTSQHQRRIVEKAKQIGGEAWWRQFKNRFTITFPEYFPSFADFAIENDKLYVFRYPVDSTCDVLILDLKGKLLKEKRIQVKLDGESLRFQQGTFKNGNYYYLYDNPDTEKWELHEEHIE